MNYILLTLSVLMLLLAASGQGPLATSAQTQDPLIGTWNIHGEANSFIGVMSFNAGGTIVEYDTTSTNPSSAESISLGKWSKTGDLNYTFREQNYVYDTSGNLIYIAIAHCSLKLSSNWKLRPGTNGLSRCDRPAAFYLEDEQMASRSDRCSAPASWQATQQRYESHNTL
jgi:hypothetical protein